MTPVAENEAPSEEALGLLIQNAANIRITVKRGGFSLISGAYSVQCNLGHVDRVVWSASSNKITKDEE